jgi:CcmD family protein
MKNRRYFALFILLALSFAAHAQPEMADSMRESGKIYVVVSVLVVIFALLFAYVIMIDRKLRKLESEVTKK